MSWISTVGYRDKEGSGDASRTLGCAHTSQRALKAGRRDSQNAGQLSSRTVGGIGRFLGSSQDQTQDVQFDAIQLIADQGIKEASKVCHVVVGLGGMLLACTAVAYGCHGSENDPVCLVAKKIAFFAIVPFIVIGSTLVFIRGLIPNAPVDLKQNAGIRDPQEQPVQLSSVLPSFNPKDPTCTSLMEAAFSGDLQIIERLQRQGEYLEARDAEGRTALHWAAIGQQQEAIELLWYFGCDFNTLDKHSYGPVHYVKSDSLKAICQKLTNAKNRFGHERPIYLFYPPETLVYKGGGPKGIAYIGVQKVFEEKGLLREVKRVAGTSAGAITAALVAVGYKAFELQNILGSKDLKDFLDHEYQTEQKRVTDIYSVLTKGGDATLNEWSSSVEAILQWGSESTKRPEFTKVLKEMAQRGGVCKGEQFVTWMDGLIQEKTGKSNCTFGQYRSLIQKGRDLKHIFVFATRIDTDEGVVCLNSQDEKWDKVIISHAIRASMSIPFVLTPHILCIRNSKGKPRPNKELGVFMDGGVTENLPIERFDQECFMATNPPATHIRQNHQTLAFNLIDPPGEESKNPASSDLGKVAIALISVIKNAEEYRQKWNVNHKHRVISIDNQGVGLVSGFFATQQTKQQLVNSGEQAAKLFLKEQRRLADGHRDHDPRQLLTIFPRPMGSIYIEREDVIAAEEPTAEDREETEASGSEEDITSSSQLVAEVFSEKPAAKPIMETEVSISKEEEAITNSSQLVEKLFKSS